MSSGSGGGSWRTFTRCKSLLRMPRSSASQTVELVVPRSMPRTRTACVGRSAGQPSGLRRSRGFITVEHGVLFQLKIAMKHSCKVVLHDELKSLGSNGVRGFRTHQLNFQIL